MKSNIINKNIDLENMPNLDEVIKQYFLHVIGLTTTQTEASRIIGRTPAAISIRMKQYEIRRPENCETLEGNKYR